MCIRLCMWARARRPLTVHSFAAAAAAAAAADASWNVAQLSGPEQLLMLPQLLLPLTASRPGAEATAAAAASSEAAAGVQHINSNLIHHTTYSVMAWLPLSRPLALSIGCSENSVLSLAWSCNALERLSCTSLLRLRVYTTRTTPPYATSVPAATATSAGA